MKFAWHGLSDEEYVERLRKTYQSSRRWMWPTMMGYSLFVVLMIGVTWGLILNLHRRVPPSTPVALLPGDQAFTAGFADSMMWFVMPVMYLVAPWLAFSGMRTWRLVAG